MKDRTKSNWLVIILIVVAILAIFLAFRQEAGATYTPCFEQAESEESLVYTKTYTECPTPTISEEPTPTEEPTVTPTITEVPTPTVDVPKSDGLSDNRASCPECTQPPKVENKSGQELMPLTAPGK
jgi:hypothetical protein